jgi:hypothetical protein
MTRSKVALPSVGTGCASPFGLLKPQSAPYTDVSSSSERISLTPLCDANDSHVFTLCWVLPFQSLLFYWGSIWTIQADEAEPENCVSGISM